MPLAPVRYAERLHATQLGLVDIISAGGVLPVLPLVDWSLDNR